MEWPPSQPPRNPRPIPFPAERLDSWKEIADYLKRDVSTAKRWERSKGLPVHRLAGGRRSTIYAFRSELDAWWHSRGMHLAQEEGHAAASTPVGRWMLGAAGVAAVLAIVTLAVFRFLPRHPPPPTPKLTPVTSYSGRVTYPAFSPDGKEVVFGWTGPDKDYTNIYVKRIGAGEPQRLTKDPVLEALPAWSPDGHSIAFVRWRPGATNAQVLVVPARGGAERLLCEGRAIGVEPLPAMSWTPDSRRLIVSCDDPPNPPGLCFCPGETDQPGLRTPAPSRSPSYHSPAISPDGQKLAFVRSSNLFLLDLNADYTPRGQPRQLTHEPCCVSNPMWTGDSREILYVKDREYMPTLMRIPADGSGHPKPVTSIGLLGSHLAISRQGDKLVYVSGSVDSDIWRVDLPARGWGSYRLLPAVRYVSSSREDTAPQISPDGTRIAFNSSRSGHMEVWVAEADGSNPFQLTSLGGPPAWVPRWSPDGKEILFYAGAEGVSDLHVVSATGGQPRRLTNGPGSHQFPSWSHDGKWIYFASDIGDGFQCWKIPGAGGDAVQLTRGGCVGGFESPDGRFFYYFAGGRVWGDVRRVPVAGGEEQTVTGTLRPLNIAVNAQGIYTLSWADPLPGFLLRLYRFATGKTEVLGRIEATLGTGLTVSSDGRWLLFTDNEMLRGDLMLVENFR
jgi:Tol biopolymer transport system component